jgi:hypothetical protein
MMKDFKSLFNNMQDAAHRVAINTSKLEYIKLNRHKKLYISDEQLNPMERFISHCIMVKVEGLDCECISQMGRRTSSQSWCGGNRWNDRVRAMQRLERCYCMLPGRLPSQQEQLFIIKGLNENGASIQY